MDNPPIELHCGGGHMPSQLHICAPFCFTGFTNTDCSPSSVSTWALEEARRRLEAEGVLADPSPSQEKKD